MLLAASKGAADAPPAAEKPKASDDADKKSLLNMGLLPLPIGSIEDGVV
jgi:hypothetical protein